MGGTVAYKYLETTVKNQNFIQEEIKSTLKFRYDCCHVTQNVFACSFL